jgi:DNA replication and repair protein RecF
MRLSHLSLTDFRNFARLDIDVPGGLVLLVGSNAQGKTSLLESVNYLATFVSFQTTNERQLINFISSRDQIAVARIKAEIEDPLIDSSDDLGSSGKHQVEVRIIQEKRNSNNSARLQKEILIDGVKRKASEVIGSFNVVLFTPQMLRIVEGAPEDRRRYLNIALSQVLPAYAGLLTNYRKILSQRNALLKQIGERGGDEEQLTYWDERLASCGSKIIHARIQAIQDLEKIAAIIHSNLTRNTEVLRLTYDPAFDPLPKKNDQISFPFDTPLDRTTLSLEKIRENFLLALAGLHMEEIQRGITTIGPHRDDLRLLSNGIDLGHFGSRGQNRTAVLALKLAEVDWILEKTGTWPVLLLDEVLAELDPVRRADLLSKVEQSEQALLTTTDLDLFDKGFINKAQVWKIDEGRLEK